MFLVFVIIVIIVINSVNKDTGKFVKCKYCHSIFNTENHDWVLTSIKEY